MLDEAEADQITVDSPEYIAPGSSSPSGERSPRSPSKDPREKSPLLNAYYTQNLRPRQVYKPPTVPQVTPASLAVSKKVREDEVGRARARSRQLGQARGSSEYKDQSPAERGSRAGSQEWICICKFCKLYRGRECSVQWPRKVIGPRK